MTRMTGDESMEYNTGAYRMLTKQGSLMNQLESIAELQSSTNLG